MTSAPFLAVGRPRGVGAARLIAAQAVLAVAAVAAIALAAPVFGLALPAPAATMLAVGAVALAACPWRRWGIYTRRFLLKTVYFPLGGSQRHRFRLSVTVFMRASGAIVK